MTHSAVLDPTLLALITLPIPFTSPQPRSYPPLCVCAPKQLSPYHPVSFPSLYALKSTQVHVMSPLHILHTIHFDIVHAASFNIQQSIIFSIAISSFSLYFQFFILFSSRLRCQISRYFVVKCEVDPTCRCLFIFIVYLWTKPVSFKWWCTGRPILLDRMELKQP